MPRGFWGGGFGVFFLGGVQLHKALLLTRHHKRRKEVVKRTPNLDPNGIVCTLLTFKELASMYLLWFIDFVDHLED